MDVNGSILSFPYSSTNYTPNHDSSILAFLDYDNATEMMYTAPNITLIGGVGPGGIGLPSRPPRRFLPRRRPSATHQAINTLSYYTCPAILAIGVISNVLAYLIFTRTRLRKVPSVPYLAAMAVVDTGALITEFIIFVLTKHGIHFITKSGVCQYVTYLNYVFIFLCMWYPVALCLEKFIAVYFPLRKAALCTPFKAKVIVIGMAVFTCVCYYYIIYMTGPVNSRFFGVFCGNWVEFNKEFNILMKLDFVFVSILPCVVLVVLVVLILARGCEYYRLSSAIEVNNRATTSRTGSSNASPILITNVVFFVVVIMLLLKLPMAVVRFYGFINSRLMPQLTLELQPVFLYMNRLDWAIKLFVYLIFSPTFRKCFASFVRTSCLKVRDRLGHGSIETEDGHMISPRINMIDRIEAGPETRACLMTSADV